MEAAKAAAQAFDPLEMDRFTRFQELTRMMAESVNDVATVQRGLQRTLQSTEDELAAQARLTRDLQDDLLRTRMVEFESLADRLYRVVRQAAKDTGKSVRLDIVGGSIEVDRGVLERMVGPFEHLLRNCVAHGIEAAGAARARPARTRAGIITITVAQEGNEVARRSARRRRRPGPGAHPRARRRARPAGAPTPRRPTTQLAQLIFVPGFSTAETRQRTGRPRRRHGRRARRGQRHGRAHRDRSAAPARAPRFRLLLPLTTAVTQVVMLRCGEPAGRGAVDPGRGRAPRAGAEQSSRPMPAAVCAHDGDELPFFWLGALLQAASGRGAGGGRSQTVIVLRSAAQRVAVHVDEVLGNQEVVVKNLGPQLSRLPGLAGITLLPSGAVATDLQPGGAGHACTATTRAARMRALPRRRRARCSRAAAGAAGAAGAWWSTTR